ncbi:unnamed protein product [Larinioides sclopetarius]|uniref:Uncharacterized protein n=1 Tax=Larinioides sclopetarius TaxID=280406 RepID=A0AAV2A975_9ARAC
MSLFLSRTAGEVEESYLRDYVTVSLQCCSTAGEVGECYLRDYVTVSLERCRWSGIVLTNRIGHCFSLELQVRLDSLKPGNRYLFLSNSVGGVGQS